MAPQPREPADEATTAAAAAAGQLIKTAQGKAVEEFRDYTSSKVQERVSK